MQRPAVRLVPGYRDLTGPEERLAASVQAALFDYLGLAGYQPIDTPLLEEADLFLRKSGGELAARIYAFTDPGGHRVALRPEFTASIIRAFLARRQEESLPVRWRYAGPVFRYTPADLEPLHQRVQVGGEFIGRAGPAADGEVLALACGGLRRLGLDGCTLVLGHLGVVQRLLAGFGLSDRADLFLMTHIRALQDPERGPAWVRQQAQEMGLVRTGSAPAPEPRTLEVEEVQMVLHQMLASLGATSVGGRDLERVEERFLEKLRTANDPESLERALEFVAELCALRGSPQEVVGRAAGTAKAHGLDPGPLTVVQELLGQIEAGVLGGTRLVVDLGLARDLAYYTGMVFEVQHPQEVESLCGGGRYDGLVHALGGEDVPALGFAFDLEAVTRALRAEGKAALADTSARGEEAALGTAVERWDAGLGAVVPSSERGASGETGEIGQGETSASLRSAE